MALKKRLSVLDLLQTLLVTLILIFSIFLFPQNSALYLTGTKFGLFISVIGSSLVLLSIIKNDSFNLSLVDVCLLFNICYTVSAISWSSNVHFLLYGLAVSIFLYISFLFFKTNFKKPIFRKIAYYSIFTAVFFNIIFLYLLTYQKHIGLGSFHILDHIALFIGENFNYISSLTTILFPFVLLPSFRYHIILKVLLSAVALFIIYQTHSAFAFLLLLGFCSYYFASFFLTKKQLAFSILAIGIAGILLITIQGTVSKNSSFVINEFFTQNDRLQMWENSSSYFSENPLVGCGRNNWSTSVSQYGYNEYVYNRIKTTYFSRYIHAHNLFFEKLSELGIIGMLPYLIIIGFIFRFIYTKNNWHTLELAALYSLLLYVFSSMIYGVVYNYADDIKRISVFSVFTLAILTSSNHSSKSLKKIYRIGFLLLLIIGSSWNIYFFYHTQKNDVILKQVQINTQKQQYDKASSLLTNITDTYQRADISFMRGKIAEAQFDYDTAIDHYYKAIQIEPHNINYLLPYGKMLYDIELYGEALEVAKYIENLHRNYLPNNVLMVKALFSNGKLEESGILVKDIREKLQKMIHNKERVKNQNAKSKRILQQLKDNLNNLDNFTDQHTFFEKAIKN